MSTYLALGAVSAALDAVLNVAGLLALAPGGVHDDVPQNVEFPCVLIDVSEDRQVGGFGTKPGAAGRMPEIGIWARVYTRSSEGTAGGAVGQDVLAKVIELLADPPAVTGYRVAAIFNDATPEPVETLFAGVKVRELATHFRLYPEAI